MTTPRVKRLALLLAPLLLVACASGGKLADEARPADLKSLQASAHFTQRWHVALGDPGMGVLQPVVDGDAVYGASGKGELVRLDRDSGRVVWRVQTGAAISGGVGAGEGLVVVGSNKGEVLAYSSAGELRWRHRVSSEVMSAPLVDSGRVVVRSGDGRIVGLKGEDGEQAWEYERAMPALTVRNHAGLATRYGLAFAGYAGGKLVAIRTRDGTVLWESSVSQPRGNTELERISDVTGLPAVDDGQVCAIAFQGRLACFDPMRGSPLWNRELSSDKGLALQDAVLYLSDADGTVLALDKATGSAVWKNGDFLHRNTGTPLPLGGKVLVGDDEGYLHALDREDGHAVARQRLSGALRAPLQSAGEQALLAQTQSGDLYLLELD